MDSPAGPQAYEAVSMWGALVKGALQLLIGLTRDALRVIRVAQVNPSVLEARVNVCRGESLRRLEFFARCVAPRASADAASAA